MRPLHLTFIALIDLIWAFNAVAVKYSVEEAQPLAAVCLRYVMVLAMCLPWLRWQAGRMGLVLVTGIVAGALFFGLGALSFSMADNVSALSIASQLGVPFSLILAVLFAGERIHWPRMAGIGLAFSGVTILAFDPAVAREGLGVMLTIAATFFYAIGTLLFRRLKGISPLSIHAWMAVVSIPALALASAIFEPGALARTGELPVSTFGWLAFSAIGASVIGHAGMSWLFQRYPVSVVTPLTLPTPLLSVIIAVIVFDNPVTPQLVAGGVLTLIGLTIITLRTAQAREVAPI